MFELRALTSERFLRELHHLLWIEPHVNRGVLDQGWNCRDHAWVAALLMHAAGRTPLLFHGRATFIGRRTSEVRGVLVQQHPHSWAGAENLGNVDLSTRATVAIDGEAFRLPIACVFANKWVPHDRGEVYVVRNAPRYARAINGLMQANKTAAIYLLESGESLSPGLLAHADAWINSPLTDRLSAVAANVSGLYCSILMHLLHFLTDDVQSLRLQSQVEAWTSLSRDADFAQSQAEATLRLN